MDIRKTSGSKAFARGQGLIPRDSVTQVRMIREQGPWKLVGGILGTVGGLAAVAGMGSPPCGAGVLPAMLLVWPAAGTAGYYAGKSADRRTTLITVR